jgi:hypothetical protein
VNWLLLLLLVAAFVPGTAQAGSGTANLSVNIQPPPSAPSEAIAAGFTTLAKSWDFSQPTYATLSNWYDCSGTDFSNPSQLFHQGNPGVTLINPCNVNQVNDGGVLVMDYQWLTSYGNVSFGGQFNQVGGQTSNGNNTSIDFPNMYVETVARVTRTFGTPQNSGGPNDVWTWSDPSNCQIELDVFELYEDSGGFSDAGALNYCGTYIVNWQSYNPNNLPPGYAVTDYHKYGALWTSDGATESYICLFVDDRLQGCGAVGVGSNTVQYTLRNRIIISAGSNAGTAAANIDMNVKYVNVYSCANWASQMCNGSTLFNSGGLTYWH